MEQNCNFVKCGDFSSVVFDQKGSIQFKNKAVLKQNTTSKAVTLYVTIIAILFCIETNIQETKFTAKVC